MAKKKNGEKAAELRDAAAGADHAGDVATTVEMDAEASAGDVIVEAATPAFVADEATFLVAEVQTFLSKRSELAERVAREIEATERRLAELKRTAALLSPVAEPAAAPAKPEKKAKKPTLKKADKKPERKPDGGDDVSPTEAEAPANDEAAA